MQWSPHPLGTAGIFLLSAFLGASAAFVIADTPGRLLLGVAALWSLLVAVRDVVVRPRLAAGPDGVVVRTWDGRHLLLWHTLRIRRRTVSRFGVLRHTLELDDAPAADEPGTLVVLGRRDVGVPLDQVERALHALNPRS